MREANIGKLVQSLSRKMLSATSQEFFDANNV